MKKALEWTREHLGAFLILIIVIISSIFSFIHLEKQTAITRTCISLFGAIMSIIASREGMSRAPFELSFAIVIAPIVATIIDIIIKYCA